MTILSTMDLGPSSNLYHSEGIRCLIMNLSRRQRSHYCPSSPFYLPFKSLSLKTTSVALSIQPLLVVYKLQAAISFKSLSALVELHCTLELKSERKYYFKIIIYSLYVSGMDKADCSFKRWTLSLHHTLPQTSSFNPPGDF